MIILDTVQHHGTNVVSVTSPIILVLNSFSIIILFYYRPAKWLTTKASVCFRLVCVNGNPPPPNILGMSASNVLETIPH